MNGELSQAAIAKVLGLAKSRVTAMKKLGMPVHSVEAAQEWRRRHVAPKMPNVPTKTGRGTGAPVRPGRAISNFSYPVEYRELADIPAPFQIFFQLCFVPAVALKHAEALGDLAAAALEAGTFKEIEPYLRFALGAVPKKDRGKFKGMPLKVWMALIADVLNLFDVDPATIDGTSKLNNPDEVAFVDEFWYQVAAGEIRPI